MSECKEQIELRQIMEVMEVMLWIPRTGPFPQIDWIISGTWRLGNWNHENLDNPPATKLSLLGGQ